MITARLNPFRVTEKGKTEYAVGELAAALQILSHRLWAQHSERRDATGSPLRVARLGSSTNCFQPHRRQHVVQRDAQATGREVRREAVSHLRTNAVPPTWSAGRGRRARIRHRAATSCIALQVRLVENENVRDRLVAGCQDDKIRERLFLELEDLTLENATLLAQNVERATSESTRLDPKHVSASQHGTSLQRIASRHSRFPSRGRHRSSSRRATARSPSSEKGTTCGKCGFEHRGAQRCKARGKLCNKCHKMGHFARVCRSSPNSSSPRRGVTSENAADITTLMVSSLENEEPTKNTYLTFEIAGVKVDLLLDTGAQASVINRQNLRRLPPRISLRQTNKRLREFTGAAVPVRGMIVAPVSTAMLTSRRHVLHSR